MVLWHQKRNDKTLKNIRKKDLLSLYIPSTKYKVVDFHTTYLYIGR